MVGAGVLDGVIIGIVLSIIWLVYVNATPPRPELGRQPGTSTFWSVEEHPDAEIEPDVLVTRFDGGL